MVGRTIIRAGIIGIVGLSPLPLASNRPWSWSLLCLLVAVLLAVWLIIALRDRDEPAVSLRLLAVPAGLFLAVCLFAAFQAIPGMPEGLRSPYWSLLPPGDGDPLGTISVQPYETWTALMRLLAYGGIFWLALQSFRAPRPAWQAVLALALITACYSAYGLIVQFSGSQTILWYDKWAYEWVLTSTFVNRNSFATFAGLGVLCAIAAFVLALGAMPSVERKAGSRASGVFIAISGLGLPGFAAIAAAAVNATALFLTASRGGTASTILAVLVMVIGLGARRRASWRMAWVLPALVVAVVAGLFQISGERLERRLDWFAAAGGLASDQRAEVYRQTLSAIGDNLFLGTGYGTYSSAFKPYRSAELDQAFYKAHNTYLELGLELGSVAASALVLAVLLLALRCLSGFRRRSRSYIISWLGFCASVLVGIHALVDFSLQIPAVAVLYATLLGMGCAQAWSGRLSTADGDSGDVALRKTAVRSS